MIPNDLLDINHQIKQCRFCRLHETRKNAVCGEGKVPSKWMIIAQAPGRIEDEKSHLLIGPSGKIFDELMDRINLKREDIYLTNLIKCFLPKCRKPKADELNTCYDLYLKKELELIKPQIIVTLGYHVSKFIFRKYDLRVPSKIGFRATFGSLFVSKNKKIVPVRHPATVVHQSKQFSKLLSDYKILETLQNPCAFIHSCPKFSEYKKGMLPIDWIEQYCYGNWQICKFYP